MRVAVQQATCGQCLLAHSFVNKLSVIVGECELPDDQVNPQCVERLRVTRQTTQDMATEKNRHGCQVRALLEDASISKTETVFESASAEYAQGFGRLWECSFILIAAPLVELVANTTGGVRQSHGR